MNRRKLVAAAAGLPLLVPTLGRAQPASQKFRQSGDLLLTDFIRIEGVQRAVTRTYDLRETVWWDDNSLNLLDIWGIQCDTVEQAASATFAVASGFEEWFIENRLDPFPDAVTKFFKEVSIRDLGDSTKAFTWRWAEEEDTPYAETNLWAAMGIVKETTAQVLLGVNLESTLPFDRMIDAAKPVLDRWPNEDSEQEVDGYMVGGIWDTLPTLDDFDIEGVAISYSEDVTEALQDVTR